MARQQRHRADVGLLCALRHAAQHQCVKHSLPKWRHDHLLDRCAGNIARNDQGTTANGAPDVPLLRESPTAPAV